MPDRVWTGIDLNVLIFKEDANGDPIGMTNEDYYDPDTDTPLLSYCFWKKADVDGVLDAARRPVTGQSHKRIVPGQYIYTATVDNFYFKYLEVHRTSIFRRDKPLRIVMQYYGVEFGNPWKTDRDPHILKHAIAKSFKITSSDKGVSQAKAVFWAEEMTEPNL